MPARDLTRWKQNDDSTWSRILPGRVTDEDGYEEMTKPQLEAQLAARGLPRTGNKAELIERLQEHDAV